MGSDLGSAGTLSGLCLALLEHPQGMFWSHKFGMHPVADPDKPSICLASTSTNNPVNSAGSSKYVSLIVKNDQLILAGINNKLVTTINNDQQC